VKLFRLSKYKNEKVTIIFFHLSYVTIAIKIPIYSYHQKIN